MTFIKSSPRGSSTTNKFLSTQFVFGLFTGIFLTGLISTFSGLSLLHQQDMISDLERSLEQSSSSSSNVQQQQKKVVVEPPGWKVIHVFFNDPNAGLKLTGLPEQDPKWFAQVGQDEIVINLMGENGGYFIDLAANDAREFSNTLALERRYGWNGLCIEPNPTYWYGLSHRKCTVVGALVGETVNPMEVKFRGVYGGIVGKMPDKMADFKKEPKVQVEQRYTTPLQDLLEQFSVPHIIDYMSLDVEGAELLIMKAFPFDKYTIKLLTIERPTKPLKELLLQNGYIFLKDIVWWGETLWAHKSTGLSPDHKDIIKIKTITNN